MSRRLDREQVRAIRDEHGGLGPVPWCSTCNTLSPCQTRQLATLALAALRPVHIADKGLT